jgi:hypothetical protein
VEVSEVGAGEVVVEFEQWDGNLLSWTIADRQTIKPTSVYDQPIAVKAKPYEGYEFIGWSSECTDETLPLDKRQITVHSYKTSCLTAHFAREAEPTPPPDPAPDPGPDPDPEPEPEPPPASGCQDTIEYKIGQAVIELLDARGFEIREK